MKTLHTSVAALAVLCASLTVFSQPSKEGGMREHRGRKGMIEELGLTDEQQIELKKLKLDQEKERLDFVTPMKTIREKVKEELLKPNPSTAKLDGYAKEMGALHEKMCKMRYKHLLEMKKILSPEQVEKLVNREWGGKGHMGMDRGMHMGGKGKNYPHKEE
jgi:Spy/CpxP family protein refolding chaperone